MSITKSISTLNIPKAKLYEMQCMLLRNELMSWLQCLQDTFRYVTRYHTVFFLRAEISYNFCLYHTMYIPFGAEGYGHFRSMWLFNISGIFDNGSRKQTFFKDCNTIDVNLPEFTMDRGFTGLENYFPGSECSFAQPTWERRMGIFPYGTERGNGENI